MECNVMLHMYACTYVDTSISPCVYIYIYICVCIWFYHVVIIFGSLFDVACSRNSSNLQPASLPHLDRSASLAKARHSAQPCDVSSAVDMGRRGRHSKTKLCYQQWGFTLGCHIPKTLNKILSCNFKPGIWSSRSGSPIRSQGSGRIMTRIGAGRRTGHFVLIQLRLHTWR